MSAVLSGLWSQLPPVPLFRSEDMKYLSITMTNEASFATVRELGRVGKLHLVDLSVVDSHTSSSTSTKATAGSAGGGAGSSMNKNHSYYKRRVQDCITLERKLLQFRGTMAEHGLSLAADELPIHDISSDHADVLAACEELLLPIEKELAESVAFQRENSTAMNNARERKMVLNALKTGMITDVLRRSGMDRGEQSSSRRSSSSSNVIVSGKNEQELLVAQREEDLEEDEEKKSESVDASQFRTVLVGTIPTDQQVMFSRMLYRLSRGNAFARFKEIKSPDLINVQTGEVEEKSVFYAVILGQQVVQRVRRMCDAFHAQLFTVPQTVEQMKREIDRINAELKEKKSVEAKTSEAIHTLLARLGSDGERTVIRDWQHALSVEKSICSTMMKAHFYLTMISLEGWVPVDDIRLIKHACKQAVANTGNPPAAIEVDPSNPILLPSHPPSYFKLNKFTECFQGIVDTYGVPRYKEANPGLFTIISFPFLFGVMYGDIGHGLALTLFAGMLVWKEAELERRQKRGQLGEIPTMAFGGRYVMLLMGLFAIYCGTIYNDCLSIPLNVYGSSYVCSDASGGECNRVGGVYPYGVDPVWPHKSNELAFFNGMKMKMAVCLGVLQMLFGICLSLSNHLYFKDWLSVYYEFIPRIIFLCSTFGYMCWMIIYKWCQDWTTRSNQPPNLIQTMIAMFLNIGSVDPDKLLYQGQAGFQTFLVICAAISVPIMLFAKPYAHKKAHEKKAAAYSYAGKPDARVHRAADDDEDSSIDEQKEESKTSLHPSSHVDSESTNIDQDIDVDVHAEFSFGDEMIHNAIHTIEFVLGCVSNTASYLRLWALSLAHAQLASVFWEKMLQQYGISSNGFMAFVGFGAWFGATFAVLLCMDVLECFLHALRLHWVEFQNKFFYADGKPFEPFVFESTDRLYIEQGH